MVDPEKNANIPREFLALTKGVIDKRGQIIRVGYEFVPYEELVNWHQTLYR